MRLASRVTVSTQGQSPQSENKRLSAELTPSRGTPDHTLSLFVICKTSHRAARDTTRNGALEKGALFSVTHADRYTETETASGLDFYCNQTLIWLLMLDYQNNIGLEWVSGGMDDELALSRNFSASGKLETTAYRSHKRMYHIRITVFNLRSWLIPRSTGKADAVFPRVSAQNMPGSDRLIKLDRSLPHRCSGIKITNNKPNAWKTRYCRRN